MNYSSAHKWFASYVNCVHNINEQEVLDYPEDYLGPNYREVLNYWFHLDSLSNWQWHVYWKRRDELDDETRNKAWKTAEELASEVIDPRFVWHLGTGLELIASHLYIERGIPFTLLPLIFDL